MRWPNPTIDELMLPVWALAAIGVVTYEQAYEAANRAERAIVTSGHEQLIKDGVAELKKIALERSR